MIIDGRTVTHDDVLRFDVCVVGAGPVGLLIARHLAGKGMRVTLLERGDDDSGRGRTRTARNGGLEYDVGGSRGFGLGGSTNKWVLSFPWEPAPWGDRFARFRELDEDDFVRRDWIPHSGWPFGKSELRRFYDLAWVSLGLPRLRGGTDDLCSHAGVNPFQDRDEIIQQSDFVLASAFFTEALRVDLAGSERATVLTNSTVVDIRCDASASRVSSVRVATQRSKGFSVEARIFILAAGGIENPRMLLASRSRQRDGLGNQHGLVGRFFMEHPHFVSGVLRPKDFSAFDPTSYDAHLHDDVGVRLQYALNEDMVRRERLVRTSFAFDPIFLSARRRRIYANESAARSLRAAANVRAALMGRARASNTAQEIKRAALGSHHVARFGFELAREKVLRRLHRYHRGPRVFSIYAVAEQVPNPDNRVRLIEAKDELGVPMARLDWRLTAQDLDSYSRSQDLLAERLVAAGYEESVESLVKRTSVPSTLKGAHHHMGTTRMSDDPRGGVVNRDCLVHGIDNLYVTGTSVFPTGGYANPTLTAMALGLRVAHHCESSALS